MRIRSRVAGVATAVALITMAVIGCGSSATQLRARGPAPGQPTGSSAAPTAEVAPKVWALDTFAPAPLPGWHFSEEHRPEGGNLVLRFYASDTLKVIGPGGPAPES